MFDTHQFTRLQLLDFPALRHVWLTSAKPLWLDRSPIRFRTCTQCIMYVSRYEVVRVIKISRRGHAPVVERNVRIGAHRPQASAAVGPCCREAASEHRVRPQKPRSDRTRHRFSVGAGLLYTEDFDRPLQYFNVVLLSLSTEPNRPNWPHAPAIALDARDAR